MKKANEDYSACWYCDNIVNHPEQIGLLYLGFPRCFVLIPNSFDFYFNTYEEFVNGATQINWLDPNDKGTETDRQRVLDLLWNFSVAQEDEEERLSCLRDLDEEFLN